MLPLVTITIPTRSWHRNMLRRAIFCARYQTYKNLELVIIEDGPDTNIDLITDFPYPVQFIHDDFKNLAAKRNFATYISGGEYICHFDDDDWSSPHRIADQMQYIANSNVALVGYGRSFWYDQVYGQAYQYKGSMWGASIMYRAIYAESYPFNESLTLAEDAEFINNTKFSKTIDGVNNFVACQHSDNTPRNFSDINAYEPIMADSLPSLFYTVSN